MKNSTRFTLGALSACLALLSASPPGAAEEKRIVLGREDAWRDLARREHLVCLPGLRNTRDLFLQDDEYAPAAEDTDLLLHFNEESFRDEARRYDVERGRALKAEEVRRLGAASAGFNGDRRGVVLRPKAGALFSRRTLWGDFTLEFWLRPSLLNDGEQILGWTGSRWVGGKADPQEVRCTVRARRLVWEFQSFFGAGEAAGPAERRIVLEGLTPLLPRIWHHHLLRFDGATGLLEYLVDGVPEAVAYARTPGGSPLVPFTGEADTAPVILGRGYTGFLDELRLSRSFVTKPVLARYADRAGVAESIPFDLGYTGTRLLRIEAEARAEPDSGIFYYYRLADRLTAEDVEGEWVPVQPGQALKEARGRFVQLRLELYPDGRRAVSPQLSEVGIVYEQDLPPAPPAGLFAVAGNGRVRLQWRPVREEDVRGYLLYYGNAPGEYHGTGAAQGPSPVDVGPLPQATLEGLSNGRLYYFAVVAYDSTEPPHRSDFSKEVSARPSGALP